MQVSNSELLVEAAKASPPVTVGGLTLFGVGLSDWVMVSTLIYTALMTTVLIRDKLYYPWKEKRNGRKQ